MRLLEGSRISEGYYKTFKRPQKVEINRENTYLQPLGSTQPGTMSTGAL